MFVYFFSGKVFVPKEPPKVESVVEEDVQTEWDDILSKATEEELVDLAGKESFFLFFFFVSIYPRENKNDQTGILTSLL